MKSEYISDVLKILLFASVTIITCVIISLGFRTTKLAKEISKTAINQMIEINSDLENSDVKKFNKTDVTGSEVINFMKRYLGYYDVSSTAPIYASVKNHKIDTIYTNNQHFSDITNFSKDRYIKPTALFSSEIIKNSNNVIVGVRFIQK